MKRVLKKVTAFVSSAAMLAGCTTTTNAMQGMVVEPAVSEVVTETQSTLRALPPPRERAAVAVYNFEDQTGQFKPAAVQTLSKAVTQGSTSVLLKALQDAGNRSWFTVIERENLDNLLKERQIIREMRRQYLGEEDVNESALPPLLFAGIILEGGIIGYDTNTVTGGAGARFLGIGAKADYREDKVTVYLRAVSVKTGEVITTVVASKKIASIGVASNVFRYVSFKELLEVDTGITTNEPDLLALRQATEKAVELLILEGADLGIWGFQDQVAGAALLEQYRAERDGVFNDVESAYAARDAKPLEQAAVQPPAAEAVPADRTRAQTPTGQWRPQTGPQEQDQSSNVPARGEVDQASIEPARKSVEQASLAPARRHSATGRSNATFSNVKARSVKTNATFLPAEPEVIEPQVVKAVARPTSEPMVIRASLPVYRVPEQETAQTISAVPAVVQPVAQGDGEDRQTAAAFYNAAISSLPALRGSKASMSEKEMRRVANSAQRESASESNFGGA